jgi:hydroxymethylpyrimidine/phosphomethylpyrimidine kinase
MRGRLALTESGPLRKLQFEAWDPDEEVATIAGLPEKGPFGVAVCPGHVIAVVGKLLTRFEFWHLPDHSVPFHHDHLIGFVLPHHPLSASNADPLTRLVFDIDEIDEWMGTVDRVIKTRHVDHIVDQHAQPIKFLERRIHYREAEMFPSPCQGSTCLRRSKVNPNLIHMSSPPVALTIAGSDCCGGAGIQADLKTFSAFGVHGVTAVTAVVAETPHLVHEIHPVPPATLQAQIRLLLENYPVAAIKTGMLGSFPHVVAVAELLEGRGIPLVVDPVLESSTGQTLSAPEVLSAYRERLLPLATVVTPNLAEAQELSEVSLEVDAMLLARQLNCAVLLTGGHQEEAPAAIDTLSDHETLREFHAPWVKIESAHGTGCTLSAAITANLARGEDLVDSITNAKAFVTRALQESYHWDDAKSGQLRALNQLPTSFFRTSDIKELRD